MFLASAINAKVHLISGLFIGALVVAAASKMKHGCWCSDNKCNSIKQPENKPSA